MLEYESTFKVIVFGIVAIAVAAIVSVACILIFDITPQEQPEVVTVVLGSSATVITGLLAFAAALRATNAARKAEDKTNEIHVVVNGRMERLLAETEKRARAEATLEARMDAIERAEKDQQAPGASEKPQDGR